MVREKIRKHKRVNGMKLFIIDANSPFFIFHPKSMINWSKVPFNQIEKKGKLKKKTYKGIKKKFEDYINEVSQMGYNAISIDDISHMVVMDFYQEKLNKKIKKYQSRFKKLFKSVQSKGLGIYVTTDIMFFNSDIRAYMRKENKNAEAVLVNILDAFFQQVPEADGVIFRIGEADGVDVDGDFKSDIIIKTAAQANQILHRLVPLFEAHQKLLIFRTWSIGAYQVGDLNWNSKTYDRALKNINSPNFIISMKPGNGDFFRYLELNQQFFRDSQHNKIIELQTRREYEGFGEFPNFLGWEHQEIANELLQCENIIGIHVWCQTGGWSHFRNFSYTKNSSFFNELNTFVTLKIFKEGISVEQALKEHCPQLAYLELIEFLRLAEEVIHELLYDPIFAKNTLFFNRTRIPPLLYVFWGFVTITTPIVALFELFVDDSDKSIRLAEAAYQKILRMQEINQSLKIPYNEKLYQDTFELLLLGRQYVYTGEHSKLEILREKLNQYQNTHQNGYYFNVQSISPGLLKLLKLLLPLFIRKKQNYRWIDYLLFNFLTAPLYSTCLKWLPNDMPEFVNEQAMPIEKLLH